MKKTTLIIGLSLLSIVSWAQSKQSTSRNDSTLVSIYNQLDEIRWIILKDRYKLYPTDNIYTFLKLDTKTGRIEQLQWSLDSDNEGSVSINSEDLSLFGGTNGTFELYPTKNMYQFILLDKVSGNQWHVQWGMEDTKRWIRRIY